VVVAVLSPCFAAAFGAGLVASETDDIRAALDQGRYPEAVRAARAHLQDVQQQSGPDSLAAARVLDLLVESLWLDADASSYHLRPGALDEQAREYAERAVKIKEAELGPDHPDLVPSLRNLGIVVSWSRREDAYRPLERALAICESTFGREHPATARALGDLAWWAMGPPKFEESGSLLERALAIQQDVLGPDHPRIATTLRRLGARFVWSDPSRARAFFRRALAMRERVLPADHPEIARSLKSLAIHQRPAVALPLLERALGIQERSLGPDHPSVAWTLSDIGVAAMVEGDYALAERTLERALAVSEKAHGSGHERLLFHLWRLARYRWDMGELENARPTLRRAVRILDESPPPSAGSRAWSLTFFSRLSLALGDDATASRLRQRALREAERTASLPGVAWAKGTILGAVGDACREADDDVEARRAYEMALSYWETVPGVDPLTASATLLGLGILETDAGNYVEAVSHLGKALTLVEERVARRSPRLEKVLSALAEAEWLAGERNRATELALRAAETVREHLRLTSRWLPERRALLYARGRRRPLDVALSRAADASGKDSRPFRAAWDSLIRSRAIVLDEMAARRRAIASGAAPAELVDRFAAACRRYANLLVQEAGSGDRDSTDEALEEQREEVERLERQLARKSEAFHRDHERRSIGYGQVSTALGRNDALVAFVRYERLVARPAGITTEATGRIPSYLAWVSLPGGDGPIAVELGSAAEIDRLLREWKSEASSAPSGVRTAALRAERRYRSAGSKLRRRVWDPIARHVRDARTVFVVPDGALHLVSFATLPDPGGSYLLETGPRLHYLSAERDLIRTLERDHSGKGLLAMGGADFEAAPGPLPGEALKLVSATLAQAVEAEGIYRGARSSCESLRGLRFESLPSSRDEVGEIARLWKGDAVLELTGPLAREDAFKRFAPDRRGLHVATHAFFAQGLCGSELAGERGGAGLHNPMRLSGMVLAGANRRDETGPEEDDGIVTAEEIASLDLLSVDWAVLSGCDTGTGEVMNGEGVLGLRRAWKACRRWRP
jgi:tetratricopeptide (TPR) repeat protein